MIAPWRGLSRYEAGLRVGDVILEINRQKVRNSRDAIELTRKIKDRALLRVWSKGGNRFVVIETPKKEKSG